LGSAEFSGPIPDIQSARSSAVSFCSWKTAGCSTTQPCEVRSQVDHSIHEIRRECTEALRQLGEHAFGTIPIRSIREAGRRFHDDANLEFRLIVDVWPHRRREIDAGFLIALGEFRATVGQQVALLAGHYDLDIEGDLATVLPKLGKEEP